MTNNFYLASRVPKQGGLVIVRSAPDLPAAYKEEIQNNCLEICVTEKDTNAVMIYPMKDQNLNLVLAKKVENGIWESRIHEDMHGNILSEETFDESVLLQLPEENFDQSFYQGRMEDSETYSDEELVYQPQKVENGRLDAFWGNLKKNEIVAFFYAVYGVLKKEERIFLQVPPENRRVLQAACYDILPCHSRTRLFTISGGECIQSKAHIFLGEQLQYAARGEYKSMDWKSFLQKGIAVYKQEKKEVKFFHRFLALDPAERRKRYKIIREKIRDIQADEMEMKYLDSPEFYNLFLYANQCVEKTEAEQEKVREQVESLSSLKIQEWFRQEFSYLEKMHRPLDIEEVKETEAEAKIRLCREYIVYSKQNNPVSEIRSFYFQEKREKEWEEFQEGLRQMLQNLALNSRKKERYVTILYLAFEEYSGVCIHPDSGLAQAPYDLKGMVAFIEEKVKNKQKRKQYKEEIIFQYASVFLGLGEEKENRSIINEISKIFAR